MPKLKPLLVIKPLNKKMRTWLKDVLLISDYTIQQIFPDSIGFKREELEAVEAEIKRSGFKEHKDYILI